LYTAYQIAAIVMTLSVLEGHSPIASLLKCDISYLWRVARSLCICRASCSVRPKHEQQRLKSNSHSQHDETVGFRCVRRCACERSRWQSAGSL